MIYPGALLLKDRQGNTYTAPEIFAWTQENSTQPEIASSMLQKLGYAVASVSSGEDAMEYMTAHSVDLLVLDMIMDRGMDGLDAYREILKVHPGQKAIIASGFSETERVKAAKDLGAGAYIKKPYVMEKLGLTVKQALEKQQT